ncbi:MAG: acyl carrier protein [Peptococcaceae bacterium]|nr:acyl carrier protein [Peptococcaceae bacterium]
MNNTEKIFKQAAALISQIFNIREDEIRPEMSLYDDPEINPLDVARLIMACEKKFDIMIHDEDVHTFVRVDDCVRYIAEALFEGQQSISVSSDEEREAWYYE